MRRLYVIFHFIVTLCQAQTVSWTTYTVGDGSITRTLCPANYQLYPRNSNNLAMVQLSGQISGQKHIRFRVVKTEFNGRKIEIHDRSYKTKDGRFNVSIPIHAELAEYSFYYSPGKKKNQKRLIAEDVVCGDAFLISGQSNIATWDLSFEEIISLNKEYGPNYYAPAISRYIKYCRSFGAEVPFPEELNWGIPAVAAPPYKFVGAPAQVLQHELVRRNGIPVCIISGAVGGTNITPNHLPEPGEYFFNQATYTIAPYSVPESSFRVYRLFTRLNTNVYAAGLEANIKGIIWLQGDGAGFDKDIGYIAEFKKLHDLWRQFFPGFRKTYLIQAHSWPDNEVDFRRMSEEQRQIPSFIPNVILMSANGIGSHRKEKNNELHFRADGYINLGKRLLALIEREEYGLREGLVRPPDVVGASRKGNKIRIYFDQPLSREKSDNLDSVLSVIKFNSGYNIKSSPEIDGHRLIFTIADTNVSALSYAGFLPNKFTQVPWFIDPDFPCYLRNANDVAALSFHNISIRPYDAGSALEQAPPPEPVQHLKEVRVYPNPFLSELTIESEEPLRNVSITDAFGKQLFYSDNPNNQSDNFRMHITLNNLQNGLYFFKAESPVHGLIRKRLVRQEN